MKKTTTAAASLTLVGLLTFALAAPASAATTIGDADFTTFADFGAEGGGSYPAEDWFVGELGSTWTAGTVTSSATGLDVDASQSPAHAVQILNQGALPTATTAADLATEIGDIHVLASNNDWVFQLPLFGESGTEFTTLRPNTPGPLDVSATSSWKTSGAITDGAGGTEFAAGADAPLPDLLAALYLGAAPTVLAYGFWVQDASVSFYAHYAFDHVTVFTPVPTRTVTPNPITPAALATTGVTVQGTGWFPGSPIYTAIYDCTAPTYAPVAEDTSHVAGVDGTFSFTLSSATEPAEGTYCVYLDDDSAGLTLYNLVVLPEITNFVVSNATTELAETGPADATPWLIGAGVAALLGAAVLLLSARARRSLS